LEHVGGFTEMMGEFLFTTRPSHSTKTYPRARPRSTPANFCEGFGRHAREGACCLGKAFLSYASQNSSARTRADPRRKFRERCGRHARAARAACEGRSCAAKRGRAQRRFGALHVGSRLGDKEHSGPLMKGLHAWMEAQLAEHKTEPNSGLGKAISYLP
jgi:hypothetical protein